MDTHTYGDSKHQSQHMFLFGSNQSSASGSIQHSQQNITVIKSKRERDDEDEDEEERVNIGAGEMQGDRYRGILQANIYINSQGNQDDSNKSAKEKGKNGMDVEMKSNGAVNGMNRKKAGDELILGPKRMAGMEIDGSSPFMMKSVNGTFV